MQWTKVATQNLPPDFKAVNPKSNKAVLVIYSIIVDNIITNKYTRILGTPEPPYDMFIAHVSFIGSTHPERGGEIKSERIKLDIDFQSLMPDSLYTVEIENYARKYGFIYRPEENSVEQFEGI